jgi:hypothetical protein
MDALPSSICVCVCCSLPAGFYFLCGGGGFMVLDAKMAPLPSSLCVCVCVCVVHCLLGFFFVRWRSCVVLGTKMAPLPSSMCVCVCVLFTACWVVLLVRWGWIYGA